MYVTLQQKQLYKKQCFKTSISIYYILSALLQNKTAVIRNTGHLTQQNSSPVPTPLDAEPKPGLLRKHVQELRKHPQLGSRVTRGT